MFEKSARRVFFSLAIIASACALSISFAQDETDSGDWSIPTVTGSGTDEKEIDPDNLVLIGRKNDEVAEQIQAARSADIEKAARIYQGLIEKSRAEYSEAFVASGPKSEAIFVPLREFCLGELRNLPEDARAKYRAIFGPAADARLASALQSRDFAAIEKIAVVDILTEAGKRAAEIAADAMFYSGDYYNALYFLDLLDSFHPNSKTPARTAMRAYSLSNLGDRYGLKFLAQNVEKSSPNDRIRAAGRDKSLQSFIKSLSREAPGTPESRSVFNLFYDAIASKDNAQEALDAMDALTIDDGEYWQCEIVSKTPSAASRYYGRYGNVPRESQGTPAPQNCQNYCVLADGVLFFRSKSKIGAIEAKNGKLLWFMNIDDSSREMEFYYPDERMNSMMRRPQTLEFADGILYFVAGSGYGQPKTLRAVQYAGGSFKELWNVREYENGEVRGASSVTFASSPLAAGGKVFVAAYVNVAGKEMKLQVLAFEAATGRPLWSSDLCIVPTLGYYSRYMGSQSSNISTLAESRGRIFVQSNIGIIASVSSHTGSVRWVKKYVRPDPGGNDPWGGRRTLAQTSWEFIPPAICRPTDAGPGEEILMATPRDSNTIVGIDPETGLTKYVVDNPYPGDRYIAGPWNGYIFAYGKLSEKTGNECLHAYDVLSGKLLLELEIEKFQARGKGIIADDILYLPGATGVFCVKLSSENISKCASLGTKEWPSIPDETKEPLNGNILICGKRFIIAGDRFMRAFAFPEPEKPAPSKTEKSKNEQKPGADWR